MSKGLSTETADVEKVKAILENYRDAMLVTTAADGSVRARYVFVLSFLRYMK